MTKNENSKGLGRRVAAVLAAVCLTAFAATFMAAPAAANVDQAQQVAGALSLSGSKIGGLASTNNGSAVSTTTVVMQLNYTGSAASANITVAAVGSASSNCIVFYAPQGTIDTSIGSATCGYTGGAYDLGVSTMNTLGQLCDAINTKSVTGGLSNYHCTLVGGIRSDNASNLLPIVTQAANVNNLKATGGYLVAASTTQVVSLGIIPAQGRHVVLDRCVVNTQGTPSLEVHGVPAKFGAGVDNWGNILNDDYLAWIGPALSATTTTWEPPHSTTYPVADGWLEFANPGGAGGNAYTYKKAPVGTGSYNGHVVVRVNVYGLGAANETTTNFLNCDWTEK